MRALICRIFFSLTLVALLGAAPASAKDTPEGPTLVVANPAAGQMITPGSLDMQGVAFDASAPTGVGVDRVSVFLDNRDLGGWHLGDATLGRPNFLGTEAQFANAGWELLTPSLAGTGDGHQLFVYARSAVTGEETISIIPVTIGTSHRNGEGDGGDGSGGVPEPPYTGPQPE